MKAIVIACKSITEDTEAFENSPQNRLSDNEMDQLSSIKVRLSNALTTLMTNAKNHATSFGNSPQSVLESSATTLTATIVDLVELVKLKTQETKREIQDIDELKVYLYNLVIPRTANRFDSSSDSNLVIFNETI